MIARALSFYASDVRLNKNWCALSAAALGRALGFHWKMTERSAQASCARDRLPPRSAWMIRSRQLAEGGRGAIPIHSRMRLWSSCKREFIEQTSDQLGVPR